MSVRLFLDEPNGVRYRGIELDDHQLRAKGVDRSPGVVVVAIDIDREDIHVGRHLPAAQKHIERIAFVESYGCIDHDIFFCRGSTTPVYHCAFGCLRRRASAEVSLRANRQVRMLSVKTFGATLGLRRPSSENPRPSLCPVLSFHGYEIGGCARPR